MKKWVSLSLVLSILLSLVLLVGGSLLDNDERSLWVGKPLWAQELAPGANFVYTLHGLSPERHYEVRVSHGGHQGAAFVLEFLDPSSPSRVKSTQKDLLDTDKMMFVTDSDGAVARFLLPDGTLKVKVTSWYNSPPARSDGLAKPIVFNIVLEELFYGAPYPVFSVAALIIGGCLLGLVGLKPLMRFIGRL